MATILYIIENIKLGICLFACVSVCVSSYKKYKNIYFEIYMNKND